MKFDFWIVSSSWLLLWNLSWEILVWKIERNEKRIWGKKLSCFQEKEFILMIT